MGPSPALLQPPEKSSQIIKKMRLKSTLSKTKHKRWKLMYVKSWRTSLKKEMSSSILSLKFNYYYSQHSSRHILSYYITKVKREEKTPKKKTPFFHPPPLVNIYQILLFVYQLPLFDDDIIIPVLTSKYFWSQRAGKTTVKIKRVCKNWSFFPLWFHLLVGR